MSIVIFSPTAMENEREGEPTTSNGVAPRHAFVRMTASSANARKPDGRERETRIVLCGWSVDAAPQGRGFIEIKAQSLLPHYADCETRSDRAMLAGTCEQD